MNNYKISILFLIQKSKVNKQRKYPIRYRITFYEGRQEFATGLLISQNTWYSKLLITKPPNEENTFVNSQLSLIKNKINQAFLCLQMKNDAFTVDAIYSQFKGEKTKKELVAFLKLHKNIKAYFHGNNNENKFFDYHDPDNDIGLK